MSDFETDPMLEILSRHCAQLIEQGFSSIRIIGTMENGDDTECYSYGLGNYYAQKGSVSEWLERRQAEVHWQAHEDD